MPSLFTSFSADCVEEMVELTCQSALSRPVVSPPISIVIPLILPPAIDNIPSFHSHEHKKSTHRERWMPSQNLSKSS